MAKLKNVTAAELMAVKEKVFDVGQDAGDLARKADLGYAREAIAELAVHEDTTPVRLASEFLSAARAMTELAHHLLVQASLVEQRRFVRDRLASDAPRPKAPANEGTPG